MAVVSPTLLAVPAPESGGANTVRTESTFVYPSTHALRVISVHTITPLRTTAVPVPMATLDLLAVSSLWITALSLHVTTMGCVSACLMATNVSAPVGTRGDAARSLRTLARRALVEMVGDVGNWLRDNGALSYVSVVMDTAESSVN